MERFQIEIGGLGIEVSSDDPSLDLRMEGAGARFLVDRAERRADPDLRLRALRDDRLEAARGEPLFDSGGLWRLHREGGDLSYQFSSPVLGEGPYKVARIDPSLSRGEIRMRLPGFPEGASAQPLDYPLDELLVMNLLARGRGAEIHSAGILDRSGAGLLFVGQSGAGKTTISRLWEKEKGVTVLSDDRTILRRAEGRYWIHGTPWHGEARLSSPRRAPLDGIFFLRHAPVNELRPVRGAAAAAALFAACFPPFHDRAGVDFTVGFLGEVAREVPCHELRFTPDPRVMPVVRRG